MSIEREIFALLTAGTIAVPIVIVANFLHKRSAKRKMRIPIQISATSLNSDHPYSDLIYVLCNDGTIWVTTVKCDESSDYYWIKVKPIPQEEHQII